MSAFSSLHRQATLPKAGVHLMRPQLLLRLVGVHNLHLTVRLDTQDSFDLSSAYGDGHDSI